MARTPNEKRTNSLQKLGQSPSPKTKTDESARASQHEATRPVEPETNVEPNQEEPGSIIERSDIGDLGDHRSQAV